MPRPTSHGSRSTRRTACIAKPAISRTRSKTLIGLYPRAAADLTIRTCDGQPGNGMARSGGPIRAASAPQGIAPPGIAPQGIAPKGIAPTRVAPRGLLRPAAWAAIVAFGAVLTTTPVAAKPATGKPQTISSKRLYGDYLAGRQAQHRRDFASAAKFYEKALA